MKAVIRQSMLVTLACFCVATAGAEESLRCGSKIVTVGMTSAEVLRYCGKPTSTEVEEHDVRSGGRVVGKTQLNRWIYERGTTGKPRILEFDQDKLISIE